MTTALETTLGSQFAQTLPEMARPWRPAPVEHPALLLLNEALATSLGLDPSWLRSEEGVRFLLGESLPDSASPVAQAYAGHQFGGYSPRLGDGRALLLGEIEAPSGEVVDLHLKGSGKTPFSRGGDGLAALGPMLREYVLSEAMHALSIPSTRSLAVLATNSPVARETLLPGAVLARTARSHLRVGSFSYARATGDLDLLRRLADLAISRHYPELASAEHPYLALLDAVIASQARLTASWMLVGFVHGVMNTDNMLVSGETIDYGPCAFLDAYHPHAVYSSIDWRGRYAYENQPAAAGWNLARFAEALLPLLSDDEDEAVEVATESLSEFASLYESEWRRGMAEKLGLSDSDKISSLAEDLLSLLQADAVDFTSFFRRLAEAARGDAAPVRALFLDPAAFDTWKARWLALSPDPVLMDAVNPLYIPRNHLVEEALAAATAGDLSSLQRLLAAVTSPYEECPGFERYAEPAPEDFGEYVTFCGT